MMDRTSLMARVIGRRIGLEVPVSSFVLRLRQALAAMAFFIKIISSASTSITSRACNKTFYYQKCFQIVCFAGELVQESTKGVGEGIHEKQRINCQAKNEYIDFGVLF